MTTVDIYKCDVCGKIFEDKLDCLAHELKHIWEDDAVCEELALYDEEKELMTFDELIENEGFDYIWNKTGSENVSHFLRQLNEYCGCVSEIMYEEGMYFYQYGFPNNCGWHSGGWISLTSLSELLSDVSKVFLPCSNGLI